MLRVMVFIDSSSLEGHLFNAYSTAVDYEKFCRSLCGPERYLVRSYFYDYSEIVLDGRTIEHRQRQRFLDHLHHTPNMEVRRGRDTLIPIDLLKHAARGNYDAAILVSHNDDFAYAVQAVKDFGRNVEIALFGESNSSLGLRHAADAVTSLPSTYLNDL